jgi:hypothetical protein
MSYFFNEEGYEGKLNSFKVKGGFKGGNFKEMREMRVKRKTPDVVEITFRRPTKKRKHNCMRFE